MRKLLRILLSVVFCFCFVLSTVGCTENNTDTPQDNPTQTPQNGETPPSVDPSDDDKNDDDNNDPKPNGNPKVVINLADGRKIKLELYPEVAPITVANFLKLVDSGFYTNTFYHRVIDYFMIQTGLLEYNKDSVVSLKPETDMIKGEFSDNGIENTLNHDAGVISMARASSYDSASGQFFICTHDGDESPSVKYLDGKYAAFGRTIDVESLDVVKSIGSMMTVNQKLRINEDIIMLENFPAYKNSNGEYQGVLVIISSISRLEE